jgi:hypothetical protein
MAQAQARGAVPEWLQSMFLYECQWILPAQLTTDGYADVLSDAEREAVLDALAGCARYITEERLFSYDATALPLESRLLLQLLAGRGLPRWVGAYRDSEGRIDVPIAAGSEVVVLGGDRQPLAVQAETVAPDYFGQDVLYHWRAEVPPDAIVLVDGDERDLIRPQWIDTAAQQRDRHRRRALGVGRGAIPAREHEVRVWKPIPGPGGSLGRKFAWRIMLWRRRLARMAKRAIHRQ